MHVIIRSSNANGQSRAGRDCLECVAEERLDWRAYCTLVKGDPTWLDSGREMTPEDFEQMAFAVTNADLLAARAKYEKAHD